MKSHRIVFRLKDSAFNEYAPTQAKQYLAHVRKKDDGSFEIHELETHLREVARGTENFAETFGSSDWGFLAGFWHDLGKYSAEFQRRIESVSGYDPEAHLEGQPGRVDHSTAGAQHAIAQLGLHGRILAYLIAGHHAACQTGTQTKPWARR